jgi:hypothetical protein
MRRRRVRRNEFKGSRSISISTWQYSFHKYHRNKTKDKIITNILTAYSTHAHAPSLEPGVLIRRKAAAKRNYGGYAKGPAGLLLEELLIRYTWPSGHKTDVIWLWRIAHHAATRQNLSNDFSVLHKSL